MARSIPTCSFRRGPTVLKTRASSPNSSRLRRFTRVSNRPEASLPAALCRDEIPGFVSFGKPVPTDEPLPDAPKPKPVFGRRTRRTRRAL